MANNFYADKKTSSGRWRAFLKTGRKAILVVHGVIPITTEGASFALQKDGRKHANPLVLVLELRPDVALLDGRTNAEVYYSEVVDSYNQYDSVLLRSNGRDLAFFDIEKPNVALRMK